MGAWLGADLATRFPTKALYWIIAVMLVGIALVLVIAHEPNAVSGARLGGAWLTAAGIAAGFVIGVVASFLGVAGGELLIPTLVLLFGVEIKLAGSLALAVSLPTMLVGFARYSRDRTFAALRTHSRFVLAMATGSVAGAFAGGLVLGVFPARALLPLLAVVLLSSAKKIWRHAFDARTLPPVHSSREQMRGVGNRTALTMAVTDAHRHTYILNKFSIRLRPAGLTRCSSILARGVESRALLCRRFPSRRQAKSGLTRAVRPALYKVSGKDDPLWRMPMSLNQCVFAGGLIAFAILQPASGRPILYAESTTIAADYRADAMRELQVSYAPTPFLALGLGHLRLDGAGPGIDHEITYARLNLLPKRWNFEAAQANIFVWGGIGKSKLTIAADSSDPSQHNHGPLTPGQALVLDETAGNLGGQVDYETTRLYASFATDAQFASSFTHRMDTLQLGFAPYKHEANGLATWFLVSATRFSGNLQQDTQVSVLLRLFKKSTWVEAGVSTEGKPQARLMITF